MALVIGIGIGIPPQEVVPSGSPSTSVYKTDSGGSFLTPSGGNFINTL